MPKSILLVIPSGGIGGIEKMASNLYHYYKAQGHKVYCLKLIALDNDMLKFQEDELSLSNKDLSMMPFLKRIMFYLGTPLKTRKIIRGKNIDVTISMGDMANVISSCTMTRETKISGIHSLKSKEFTNRSPLNRLYKWALKNLYGRFNKTICISEAVKTDLIHNCGYPYLNTEVIFNPHDLDAIKNLAEEDILSIEEKSIFNETTLLFVGRLSYEKAPWHLLNSFYLAMQKGLDSNLVFIGDSQNDVLSLLRKRLNSLDINNRVFFLGRKSNPYPYIKRASGIALTSYFEGTPNVIVEAIALDTPIISSNCTPSLTEMMVNKVYKSLPNQLIKTDAGIITPTFFKDSIHLPNYKSKSLTFTEEEKIYANGIQYIINHNESIKNNLKNQSDKLTYKFNLNQVANQYLKI